MEADNCHYKSIMLEKGKAAATPEGMRHNVKVMKNAGYSEKRAVGTAYGEVGMEKMARRHEREGMMKSMKRKRRDGYENA